MPDLINFELNGTPVELDVDGNRSLLWVLRNDLDQTGTKYGCGWGYCGACTVLVDGRAERSCNLDVKRLQGRSVVTIEGIADGELLHPVQQAFVEHDALQCGYCTPGMIMNAVALLSDHPAPTNEQIAEGMNGNLCRCGAHHRIVRAIQTAAENMNR